MSKTFVADIKEGFEVSGVFLVDTAHRRFTKAKKEYLKVVLADKTGQIESVMWDETMEKNPDAGSLGGGVFIDIDGRANVNRYTNKVEVVLNHLRIVALGDLDITDFLPTTERDIEELEAELKAVLAQVDDGDIKKLLDKIFKDKETYDAFTLAPAAKGFHHAYLGGLLEHSVSVGRLAVSTSEQYPAIDKSLLIAGALLHDIGKTVEFDYTTKIDYSTKGRLQGHMVLGNEMVLKAADSIKGFPQELKAQVSHLILSHHGEPEYGAVVRPKTLEAVMLNLLDNVDAKMNGWLGIAKKYDEGVEWTEFQKMFSDLLYLGPTKARQRTEAAKPVAKGSAEEAETLF